MEKVSRKIRILCINPGINYCGGVESYSINYFRNINRSKFQIDFAAHSIEKLNYKSEIEKCGSKVYIFPKFSLKNVCKIMKQLDLFFKENSNYDIIHCNMANASPFYFYYARKNGIKIRILHSHQSKYAKNILHAIRNIPLIWLGKKMATNYVACTNDAGKFLFSKCYFTIISNAINIEKFSFSKSKRDEIRKRYNLNNKIVVGHVGRLSYEKNHNFMIEILYELKKINNDVILMLIGSGEEEINIREKINKLGLTNDVKFIGDVNNPEDYYQAMDVFLFPSFYEGLGIAAIEAQISGLPVVCNKKLPSDLNVTKSVIRLELKDYPQNWANMILKASKLTRKDNTQILKNSNFNIQKETIKLENLYERLMEKNI